MKKKVVFNNLAINVAFTPRTRQQNQKRGQGKKPMKYDVSLKHANFLLHKGVDLIVCEATKHVFLAVLVFELVLFSFEQLPQKQKHQRQFCESFQYQREENGEGVGFSDSMLSNADCTKEVAVSVCKSSSNVCF